MILPSCHWPLQHLHVKVAFHSWKWIQRPSFTHLHTKSPNLLRDMQWARHSWQQKRCQTPNWTSARRIVLSQNQRIGMLTRSILSQGSNAVGLQEFQTKQPHWKLYQVSHRGTNQNQCSSSNQSRWRNVIVPQMLRLIAVAVKKSLVATLAKTLLPWLGNDSKRIDVLPVISKKLSILSSSDPPRVKKRHKMMNSDEKSWKMMKHGEKNDGQWWKLMKNDLEWWTMCTSKASFL